MQHPPVKIQPAQFLVEVKSWIFEIGFIRYPLGSDGDGDGVLTPGGMARLSGHRLKFDPADPEQGLLLMAADRTTRGTTRGRAIIIRAP